MNFIRQWREYRGLTQQALGDGIDPPASPGTISSYESGSRKTSLVRLTEIARVLETTPSKLLGEAPPGNEAEQETDNVISIWSRIPSDRRGMALDILRKIADG